MAPACPLGALSRVGLWVGVRAPEGSGLCRYRQKQHWCHCFQFTWFLSLCLYFLSGVFVRFFYVSRQCTKYCPIVKPADVLSKSFILLKPTPFLYASCCRTDLCNTDAPNISETEGNYKEAGRAGDLRGGSAGLVLFLTLTSVSLGLGLS